MNTDYQSILVVDIETTGFLDQGGKIVEIGIVKLDLDTGNITPVYSSLIKEKGFDVNHTKEPYGWIFNNSDLTFEEVNNAPSLDNQRNTLQSLFYQYEATAYNKEFDFGFLKDRGFIIRELPCPMIILTDILKLPTYSGNGYKWPKVEEAWKYFFGKTIYRETHRAIDDAIHEAKIVYQLFRKGYMKTVDMDIYQKLICQFCNQNIVEKGCEINQVLYKVNKKRNLFRDDEYTSININIPRCCECKARHEKEKFTDNSILIFTVIMCIILFSTITSISNGSTFSGILLGGFAGFFAGAFLQKILRTRNNKRNKVNKNILSHPLIREKINEGWSHIMP
jgi:DNA polymerase-3 subunit epsilon